MTELTPSIRSLIRLAAKSPGAAFQPIVIEYVPSSDEILLGIGAIVGDSVRVVTSLDDIRHIGLQEKAFIVVSVDEALKGDPRHLLGTPPTAQVVLYTTTMWSGAGAEIDEWVNRSGIVVRTRYGDGSGPYATYAAVFSLALERPGRVYNPLVIVDEAASGETLVEDAFVRLVAAGLSPIIVVDREHQDTGQAQIQEGSCVLVDLRDCVDMPDAAVGHIVGGVESSCQVVVIVGAGGLELIESIPTFDEVRGRMFTCKVRRREGPQGLPVTAPDEWPPLRDVLAFRPFSASPVRPSFNGSLLEMGLPDVLQIVGRGSKTGRMVLYSGDRLAIVDFEKGRVRSVGPDPDGLAVPDLTTLHGIDAGDHEAQQMLIRTIYSERLLRVARWPEARFVYWDTEGAPVGGLDVALSIDGLIMDYARRIDELPAEMAELGSIDVALSLSGLVDTPEVPVVARLLEIQRAGGSLLDAAAMLGIDPYRAVQIAKDLIEVGAALPVISRPEGDVAGRGDSTLDALWAVGLVGEVQVFLEQFGGWASASRRNADLAWAAVYQENSEAAAKAFLEASGHSTDVSRRAGYLLNALLIQVRTGVTEPSAAFRRMRELSLERMIADGAHNGREIAAAYVEICLRSGRPSVYADVAPLIRRSSVRSAYDRLFQSAEPTE